MITSGINTYTEMKDYQNLLQQMSGANQEPTGAQQNQGFGDMFDSALNQIDTAVNKTDSNVMSVVTGTQENLHDAMIDLTEAQLTMQTAIQVRNKMIDSLNEVKNMQF